MPFSDGDKFDHGAKDRNHAKVYVGVYHHTMFTTRKTSNDNAGTTPGDEFRSNDWYFLPWDTTVQDDSRINRKCSPLLTSNLVRTSRVFSPSCF